MIKLIGVLIIILGFYLKLDTIAIVLIAGLATGFVSGLDFVEILSTLGTAFVQTRYMSLFLITLAVVGILERNGLRERAAKCISKLEGATAGRVLSFYMVIRIIASAMSIRLGGHVQFIRPLIYPMAKGAAEKKYEVTEDIDDKIKAVANSVENYGNFFGQNVFVASAGVLLIVGTFQELGIEVIPYSVSKASIPVAIITVVLSLIQNMMLDRKINKTDKKR
ncbi:MAG: DUF969 domain-containing protein [Cetobacterium sp.]|uniref:DUF969 domain-containing protein n=1 Tax=unclassified Cetobacterium TaxID=2630983 RepID=UPI00163C7961|nr:DUF969 domain-containing protein [Cetobacterium sp. 2A]MBC2856760.1 DUF969 domain-containing protein [Cetobacterium sp. 2A]